MAAATVNIGATNVNQQGTTVVTLTLTLTSNNFQGTVTQTPTIMSNAFSIQRMETVQTVNGTVPVTIPTGAQGVIWQAPTAGTLTLTVKTTNGDVGIPVGKTGIGLVTFDTAPPASLFIVSNGVEAVELYWF